MKRRTLLLSGLAGAATLSSWSAHSAAASRPTRIEIFKNPHCGCCGEWVRHMEAHGFEVKVTPVDDTGAARKRLGLPDRYGSCHTAVMDGYVLEGHVPAREATRLLTERPDAIGLAVPGMPVGSPGMEQGARRMPYDVLLIDRAGKASVYARYPGSG